MTTNPQSGSDGKDVRKAGKHSKMVIIDEQLEIIALPLKEQQSLPSRKFKADPLKPEGNAGNVVGAYDKLISEVNDDVTTKSSNVYTFYTMDFGRINAIDDTVSVKTYNTFSGSLDSTYKYVNIYQVSKAGNGKYQRGKRISSKPVN